MFSVALAIITSLVNLAYAASIYMSLHGWLVSYEPSGMQLIAHIVITAPVVVGTSIWLFVLAKAGKCSSSLWMANLLGLLIPAISLKTGITYHGYDKLGLFFIGLLSLTLIVLLVKDLRQVAPS